MSENATGQLSQFRTGNGQFRTDLSGASGFATEHAAQPCGNQESETRSGNGQFWSDSSGIDQKTRADLFRAREWALYEDLIDAARSVTADMRKHPRRGSLSQIANVLLLASQLGRRACGMPIDQTSNEFPAPQPLTPTMEEALNRIYGPTAKSGNTWNGV